MITFFKKIYTVLLLAVVLVACKKDFLEVVPKGQLIASTIRDYDMMLNNDALGVINPSIDVLIPLGDEICIIDPYVVDTTTRDQKLFRYRADVYRNDEDAPEITSLMKQLYTFNKIINEVKNAVGGSEEQIKSIQAEACLGRAWINFMMVNYYGKPYNPSTANTDLSFPIITTADVTATKFKRATVQELYDFIISDLTTAAAVLPVNSEGRTRGSKAAAEGMLGKTLLFMGNFNEAMPHLTKALNSLATNYTVKLYDYNETLEPFTGSWGYNPFFTPLFFMSGPAFAENQENILPRQFATYLNFISPEFVLNQKAAKLFGPNDLRWRLYTNKFFGNPADFLVPGVYRRNAFGIVPCGLTLPDLYLLSAECKARTNDIGGAIADLETLRKNRMPVEDAIVNITDKDELIKFIIDERTREFALMGYRWLDMRRLSTDPLFKNTTYVHEYIKVSGETIKYPLSPERFVLKFPGKVMLANPDLINNP